MDARERWQERYAKSRVRDADFTTLSGMEVEPVYGTADSEWPGEFPYTRGLYATGYRGRTGVYELMVADERVRALVHNRAAESAIREAALAGGMRLMREDGDRLVREGITSREEVLRVTRD